MLVTPKHKDAWDDTKSAVWGKGKALFAPTKQSDIWSSLAAVAIYELKFVVASLHSHQAPPIGHIVAHQRLALTPAGLSWLASDCQELLVRERFVEKSAWQTIAARCGVKDCTNKATKCSALCSRHNMQAATTKVSKHECSEVTSSQTLVNSPQQQVQLVVKPPVSTSSQCTPAVFQLSVTTGTQCTPPGCLTQDASPGTSQVSSFVSQVSLVPTQPHTETYTFAGTTPRDNHQSASKPIQKHGAKSTSHRIRCRQL